MHNLHFKPFIDHYIRSFLPELWLFNISKNDYIVLKIKQIETERFIGYGH